MKISGDRPEIKIAKNEITRIDALIAKKDKQKALTTLETLRLYAESTYVFSHIEEDCNRLTKAIEALP